MHKTFFLLLQLRESTSKLNGVNYWTAYKLQKATGFFFYTEIVPQSITIEQATFISLINWVEKIENLLSALDRKKYHQTIKMITRFPTAWKTLEKIWHNTAIKKRRDVGRMRDS